MKKVIVNEEACIGCGACVAIDPQHFAFNDSRLSEVVSEENLDTMELQNAIESCPTAAIVMEECKECNCQNGDECTCEECDCENCNCECDEECHSKDDCECCCECQHHCE